MKTKKITALVVALLLALSVGSMAVSAGLGPWDGVPQFEKESNDNKDYANVLVPLAERGFTDYLYAAYGAHSSKSDIDWFKLNVQGSSGIMTVTVSNVDCSPSMRILVSTPQGSIWLSPGQTRQFNVNQGDVCYFSVTPGDAGRSYYFEVLAPR